MNIEIANRLFEMRKKNNLSQEELAERIGVSRQAVSKWERAESSPDTDNLIGLARLYNVSLDELLFTVEPVDGDGGNAKEDSKPEFDESIEESWEELRKRKFASVLAGVPVPLIVTAVYLYIGFTLKAWHPSWLIFFVIPIYYSIVNLFIKK